MFLFESAFSLAHSSMHHQFREYLEANGYDTSAMGMPGESVMSTVDDRKSDEKIEEKTSQEA